MNYVRWKETRRHRRVTVDAAPPLSVEHLSSCHVVQDRYALLDALPKQAVVAEVGVLFGDFSEEILRRTEPRELHLIDIEDRWGDRFEGEADRVHTHRGSSTQILANFPDGYFDWIYIDADHRYESVRADAEIAKHKIKPAGLLVFNDYMTYNPICDVSYGVARAVHELCREDHWRLNYMALESVGFFDVVISRIQPASVAPTSSGK